MNSSPLPQKTPSYIDKVKLWATGISSYYILTYFYDYFVVSFLLLYFGLVKGVVITMILSVIVDLGTLKFYDWLKKDWLALETLKDLQNKKNLVGKLFYFVRNKSTFITVIVLSLTSNAFMVTAYMRKGSFKYNGLTKRDWQIFLFSSLLTNLYWVFIIAGGIELVKYISEVIINLI